MITVPVWQRSFYKYIKTNTRELWGKIIVLGKVLGR
jgi:hypothetical protein